MCKQHLVFYDSFEVNDVRKTYLVTSYKAQDGSIINREIPVYILN